MNDEDTILGYSWKNKKVLITGASGFKGSWLSKILLELGAKVYGTTRNLINPKSAYSILDVEKDIIQINADISEPQQMFDALNSIAPDVIFHLAAKAQVPVAQRDPLRAFQVNIMGTINILEGCRQLQVGKRLLIISTDHVFGHVREADLLPGGEYEGGFHEQSRVSYSGPYDTSKSAMELCIRSYHRTYCSQLPAIGITRACNVFGLGDVAPRRFIPGLVRDAVTPPKKLRLRYRKPGRQYIHMTDVIAGYVMAASSLEEDKCFEDRSPFTPTFHFAIEDYGIQGQPFIRVEELGRLAASIFGAEYGEASNCIDYPPNENPVQALNCKATQQKLGWKPRTKLEDGLREIGEWYLHRDDSAHLKQLLDSSLQKIMHALY